MINKIVIDGNDGTGKSTRVTELRKLFPGIRIEDRGIFSKATLNDDLFNDSKKNTFFTASPREKFYNSIKSDNETLYVILDAYIETCQDRIKARGDRLDCEFHNKEDLAKYKERFESLVNLCSNLPNVMLVYTD